MGAFSVALGDRSRFFDDNTGTMMSTRGVEAVTLDTAIVVSGRLMIGGIGISCFVL